MVPKIRPQDEIIRSLAGLDEITRPSCASSKVA
jgi:hypothetical protein